jgi:hypothetical protein
MAILCSLCNIVGEKPSSLLLVDDGLCGFRWVRLPPGFPAGGVTGLAMGSRFLYAAVQTTGQLAILDKSDLTLRSLHTLAERCDVHSLLEDGERVFAVATGLDTVLRLGMKDGSVVSEQTHWRPDPGGPPEDRHHLNSLSRWHGRLLVSGMGSREDWPPLGGRPGFVRDAESGETVAEGLHQPHSVTALGEDLFICESRLGVVRNLRCGRSATFSGYARGLCASGGSLFAAITKARRLSRSTGAVLNPQDPDDLAGRYALMRLDPETLETRAEIALDPVANEVYDLLAAGEEASSWPLLD